MKEPVFRFKGYTDDWEQRKLDDITNRYDNLRVPVAASLRVPGETPYYGANGIQDYVDGFTHDGEYILVAEDGANDLKNYPIHYVNGRVWVNNHAHVLQAKISEADNRFLAYAIGQADIESLLVGGGRAKLNANIMMDMEVVCPSKEEQKKIGTYFSNLDNLIALNQRKCDALKELKKGMLQKMFPKDGEKVPEFRFKGFTGDWEQRKLDDVVDFLDTMRKPLEEATRVAGPYPYYGASGIVDYVDGYIFDEELVLLSEDGANITDRNYPVCFLASGKYWVNNHAHVLRVKEGNENNFICNSLERKDFNQYNSGMAMPKLNKEVCKGIPITCPLYDEQKKIGDYFRNLDKLIALHQRKCEALKELKKGFLQKMFI